MNTKPLSFCLMILLTAMLAACGGSNNNIGDGTLPDQNTGGIWVGEWCTGPCENADGSDAAFALSTEIDAATGTARFSMLVLPALVQIVGTLEISGDQVTGTGTAYTTVPGDSFPGGATTTAFNFAGTLREGQFASGEWTVDAGDSGSFDLDYDEQHLRGANLARLGALWTLCEIDDNPELCASPIGTFDIDANGMIFRQTADCTSIGMISVPNPLYNIYEWSADVTSNIEGSCGIEGQYSGLGALTDTTDEPQIPPLNDEFDVLVNSDTLAIPLLLIRDL